jgi:hypothetical protein
MENNKRQSIKEKGCFNCAHHHMNGPACNCKTKCFSGDQWKQIDSKPVKSAEEVLDNKHSTWYDQTGAAQVDYDMAIEAMKEYAREKCAEQRKIFMEVYEKKSGNPSYVIEKSIKQAEQLK